MQSQITYNGQAYIWRNEAGQIHREDGPAVEYNDGDKEWFYHGLKHRTDGPAFEGANGTKSWWVNGKLHRADGPAVEYADGSKAWYVNGAKLTEAEFNSTYTEHKTIVLDGITYKLVKM